MGDLTDEEKLRAKVEALDAMVTILAVHLSRDPSARRKIDDSITREAQAFRDNHQGAEADALHEIQNDLDGRIRYGD